MKEKHFYEYKGFATDEHDNYLGQFLLYRWASSEDQAALLFRRAIAEDKHIAGRITLDGIITEKGGER